MKRLEENPVRTFCPCGFDDGGSHYHCAHCGGVCSMYGHYNFETSSFNCPEFPVGVYFYNGDEDE